MTSDVLAARRPEIHIPADKRAAKLSVRHVSKSFGGKPEPVHALDDVSIEVYAGEFVAIIGPSGGGKSTLLNILSGLDEPDHGTVALDGTDVTGQVGLLGYMPQKDLLMPWRNVLDNTILGLELAGMPRKMARAEALSWFPRFGLEGFDHRYPAALSGGMRQRAALLRTFLSGRDVLLLDEPFGALDAMTRAGMQEWLLSIRQSFSRTVVLVTHDVDEALHLADRVYVMSARPGKIHAEIDVLLDRRGSYGETVTSENFVRLKRSVLAALHGIGEFE
jgi:ABC-type nitrate/sulfonate/bicarbonate transport system ATPase subunit